MVLNCRNVQLSQIESQLWRSGILLNIDSGLNRNPPIEDNLSCVCWKRIFQVSTFHHKDVIHLMYYCDSIRLDKISSHGEIRKHQHDDTLNSVLIQLNQRIFLTACSVMLSFEAHLFMNNPNLSIFFVVSGESMTETQNST